MERICVWPNGLWLNLGAVSALKESGLDTSQVATMPVKPNEHPDDVAHRHAKAEASYWRSL